MSQTPAIPGRQAVKDFFSEIIDAGIDSVFFQVFTHPDDQSSMPLLFSQRICRSIRRWPATSGIDLGFLLLKGLSRLPKPPAKIAASNKCPAWMGSDNVGSDGHKSANAVLTVACG